MISFSAECRAQMAKPSLQWLSIEFAGNRYIIYNDTSVFVMPIARGGVLMIDNIDPMLLRQEHHRGPGLWGMNE